METTSGAVRRPYDSSRRKEQASLHRVRILQAARSRFLEQGYAATTLAGLAADAGVSVETIYKAFGNKAGLLKSVFDFSVAGDDEQVAMIDRDFAVRMRSEPDPRVKLELFAAHMSESMPRAAPIYLLARSAAASSPEIAALHAQWKQAQLEGLGALARGLAAEGALRPGLDATKARDLLWTVFSTEVYELLVLERGRDIDDYRRFLAEGAVALLLDCPAGAS